MERADRCAVPIGPSLKMENRVIWVLCHFFKEFLQAFGFGLEMVIFQVRGIEIEAVEVL